MAVRRIYSDLSETERARYVDALYHLKSTGLIDEYAEMHAMHFSQGIHRSSHFLPWHREFLVRFEQALQSFHPDITIPYWDSTVSGSPADPLWADEFLGQFNSAWALGRALGNAILPTSAQVAQNQARSDYSNFWRELELDIHNPPHRWVGGVMASAASPGDPVFFMHHCWIDLLWIRWQLAHPGAPFISSGHGAGLNDPLMGWENRTAADVIDHHALGYTYDIE